MAHSPGHNAVLAAINAGLLTVFLGILVGYAYGRKNFNHSNTLQVHMYRGYNNSTGILTYGFACLCEKIPGNTTVWNGDGDTSCNSGSPDKAILLNSTLWIPQSLRVTIPAPPGACCKLQPKTSDGNLPNVNPGTSCWLSG